MNKNFVEERMLPAESLFDVLAYLKLKELLKASQVSKSWYHLIHNYEDVLKKEHVKKYIKNLLVQHVTSYSGTIKDTSMASFISIARKLHHQSKTTARIMTKTTATIQKQLSPSNLIELFRLSFVQIGHEYQSLYQPLVGQMDFKKIIFLIMLQNVAASAFAYLLLKYVDGRDVSFFDMLAKAPSAFLSHQSKVIGYAFIFGLCLHFVYKLYENIMRAHASYEQSLLAITQENNPTLDFSPARISGPAVFKTICWEGASFFKLKPKMVTLEASRIEMQSGQDVRLTSVIRTRMHFNIGAKDSLVLNDDLNLGDPPVEKKPVFTMK